VPFSGPSACVEASGLEDGTAGVETSTRGITGPKSFLRGVHRPRSFPRQRLAVRRVPKPGPTGSTLHRTTTGSSRLTETRATPPVVPDSPRTCSAYVPVQVLTE